MKLKKFTIVILLFTRIISYSQQIGEGYAPIIQDFSMPLKTGIYNGYESNTISMAPDNSHMWQHLFVARHTNISNNHQLQIASSFAVNDRLFFRKIVAGDLSSSNSTWLELATRGSNTFNGNQTINGNFGIGTINPKSKFTVRSGGTGVSIHPGTNPYFGTLAFNRESESGEIFDSNGQAFQINNGGTDKHLHFQVYNGNATMITNDALVISGINGYVGIGTSNITSKLTVAGNIASREVKVTVDAGADFVFKNDYNLPSLESVETYIKEKNHLPEIASANEMVKNGINLSEMNIKLLQKIEELTLYMIEIKKENIEMKKQNEVMQKEYDLMKNNQLQLKRRLSKIENK